MQDLQAPALSPLRRREFFTATVKNSLFFWTKFLLCSRLNRPASI